MFVGVAFFADFRFFSPEGPNWATVFAVAQVAILLRLRALPGALPNGWRIWTTVVHHGVQASPTFCGFSREAKRISGGPRRKKRTQKTTNQTMSAGKKKKKKKNGETRQTIPSQFLCSKVQAICRGKTREVSSSQEGPVIPLHVLKQIGVLLINGWGSKLNSRGYAGVGPCFRLPGFHFGTGFLSHSQMPPPPV